MPVKIQFNQDARNRMCRGALKVGAVVQATYGPSGGLVAAQRRQGILHTKDGMSVAMEVQLKDPLEDLGAQIVKQACKRVGDTVGDGTSTTALLISALVQRGNMLQSGDPGGHPRFLLEGLKAAQEEAHRFMDTLGVIASSQHVLQEVALIASNCDEEIAVLMAGAVMDVGKYGAIMVDDSLGVDSALEFKDGLEIKTSWLMPELAGDDGLIHRADVLVALVCTPLTSAQDVVSIMEEASVFRPEGQDLPSPLLIVAPAIRGEALTTLRLNNGKSKESAPYLCMICPGPAHLKGEMFKDIAALSGAVLVDPQCGMSPHAFDRAWFGALRSVVQKHDRCAILSYDDDPRVQQSRDARVKELFKSIQVTESAYDRDQIQKRLGDLTGGLCVLKIGGITEAALKERRARVEDALRAVQAALRSGVVPGGAVAYLAARRHLRESERRSLLSLEAQRGWGLLEDALAAPFKALVRRSDVPAPILMERVEAAGDKYSWMGWDVMTSEVRDFTGSPAILDPVEVVQCALKTAVSAATTLLGVGVAITGGGR